MCYSFGVESFNIYTYQYIDSTADKGLCESIHFHYIDSYYGRRDTDFVCRLPRKRFVGPGHQHFSSSALGRDTQKPMNTQKQTASLTPITTDLAQTNAAQC